MKVIDSAWGVKETQWVWRLDLDIQSSGDLGGF
jgi:hypothetical protein